MRIPRSIATVGLAALACSQDVTPPPVRNLDRPSSIAFGCYGDMRITDPESSNQGDVVVSAQPISSCVSRLRGEVPEGQENIEGEPPLVPPRSYAFVLQSARGTVGVIETETQVVIDSDPLTPGKNSIPIGTLPVGLAADASGCYMVAANAGSCDLGVLDVTSALRLGERARIARIPITNAAGELMRARPRAMVAGPQVETVGLECPAASAEVRPRGSLFVAYPTCNLVAVVDAATGTITAGIQFDEDGVANITDGNVSCPQECGDGSIVPPEATSAPLIGGIDAGPDAGPDAAPSPDAGPATTDDRLPRPVALDLGPDGRLYIGSENSPLVTTVTLDEAGLPSLTTQARLEGDVGVTALSASHVVEEGGELGTLGGSAGNFQFVYAVATDRTVRVIDLERQVECDAQVDPRYLYDIRDPSFLSCMPVGDPTTPPRRPGARSPGIHMPRDAVPLDVTFALVNPSSPVGDVAPAGMVGTYAFVTTSDGFVYIINVDDDNYPDFEDEDDPTRANMVLAVPHQLRDFVGARDAVADNCQPPTVDPPEFSLGPRLTAPPSLLVTEERVALDKVHLMPNLHQVMCTAGDDRAAVSALDFTAPVEVRERNWPDWRGIFNEQVTITWEGGLSRDDALTDLDGPPVRNGAVEQLETRVRLRDPNNPFCQIGAELFDVISLIGCDPSLGDAQCGIGEVCYVHPDAPTVVPTGVCMPAGKTDQLSGLCRDFLITRRQYAARSVLAGEVTLGNRRRVLRTSPLAGCTSDEQCQDLAAYETTLSDPHHPIDLPQTNPASDYRWTCVADPTRAPAPDRCVMACETSEDCEPGLACNQGFCIEGVIPPAECVSTVQRYTVRASDAFVVIGARTGYLHNRIADPESGECVADPDANPLLVGRIPLTAPPCTGDGLDAVSPNPCSTTVTQAEVVAPFELEGERCEPQNEVLRERETGAIRFTNPAFTLHLVDVATTGDAECNGDRSGTLPAFAPVYPGFQLFFEIVGGFFPMFVPGIEASYPIVIQPGPDGRVWVLDEGDSSISTFGRVFTLIPEAGSEAFAVIQIL
jgi:hypothetical protein